MSQKRAHIVVPETLLADIDSLVGKRGRSAFLTEVLDREVRRRKLLRALESPDAIWKDADHPELQGGAAAWVESLRRTDAQALDAKLRDKEARD